MIFGSLFSGMGGFDLGLERAGHEIAFQVEKDRDCRRVLKGRWPKTPRWRKVEKAEGKDLPRVDALCGGFPCQDLSVAGKRAGLAGGRSGLWFEFLRLIEEVAPVWVLIENVPGLFSSCEGRDFAVVISGLAQFGYGVAWRVLDSQYFGVPQRRRRVFVVGCLGSPGRAAQVLFEPESCNGDSAPSQAKGETNPFGVGEGFETSGPITAGIGKGPRGTEGVDSKWMIPFTVHAERSGAMQSSNPETAVAFETDTARNLDSTGGYANGQGGTLVFNPYRTMIRKGEYEEGFKPDMTHDALTANPPPKGPPLVFEGCIGRNGRGQPQTVCPSLKGSQAGETSDMRPMVFKESQSGNGIRRLTPKECLRLQAFPDDWLDLEPPLSDSAKYRMVGNAVTVNVIEWIGGRFPKKEKRRGR